MSRGSPTREMNKYGEIVSQCDWCGKSTTKTVRAYYGNYCSPDCKTASRYWSYVGSLIFIIIVVSIDILIILPNPDYWLELAAILFLLSIAALMIGHRIRIGHSMRKVRNEETYW
ncbi:MAG: hypothetical protein ACFFED_17695 [Candidatus Thorarchaeota archaeon]